SHRGRSRRACGRLRASSDARLRPCGTARPWSAARRASACRWGLGRSGESGRGWGPSCRHPHLLRLEPGFYLSAVIQNPPLDPQVRGTRPLTTPAHQGRSASLENLRQFGGRDQVAACHWVSPLWKATPTLCIRLQPARNLMDALGCQSNSASAAGAFFLIDLRMASMLTSYFSASAAIAAVSLTG